jgi:phenylpropionate dioxygenase-like ring-hydroxylating dioxygenase large terminal subunit
MVVTDTVFLNDWHPVVRSQDLQEGTIIRAQLLEEDLVLWSHNGQVYVFQDLCPHRGARLSLGWVEEDALICPFHGLAFNSKGHCVRIPANPKQSSSLRNCIKTYQAKESYGLIWVSLGNPTHDIAPFPVWNDPNYRCFLSGPYHFQSSPLRTLESFIDLAHVPFLHQHTLGDCKRPMINDYQVEFHQDGITFNNVRVWMRELDTSKPEGGFNLNTFNYRIPRPLTACFEMGSDDSHRVSIFYTVTPVSEEECIAWHLMALNYGHEIPKDTFQVFIDKVNVEDISIVNSQRPKLLPLDPQKEFHLQCDRASIAYRKWLKQLGVTFGAM